MLFACYLHAGALHLYFGKALAVAETRCGGRCGREDANASCFVGPGLRQVAHVRKKRLVVV